VIVLVINCGSSSVKYEAFQTQPEKSLASGLADRVTVNGGRQAILIHHSPAGDIRNQAEMPTPEVALGYIVDAVTDPAHGVVESLDEIGAVGHRVVHGGEQFSASTVINEEVISAIQQFCELAPLHNPANLEGIHACQKHLPDIPQVAVFDTAFHQTIPRHAFIYGLPYDLYQERGIRRYGFHGTSHRYVASRATEILQQRGTAPQDQRVITCHLGNGCSMTAVRGGKSIDTSLGFTPLEGLLMGTRCGDLDPAIVPYLISEMGLSADQVDDLLNQQSGLLGVSGVSSDMRDVSAAAVEGNERAQLALDIFCYRIKKYIGAYAAALGGLDAVVFTAGIGENDPEVRRRSVAGLGYLGLHINDAANQDVSLDGQPVDISSSDSPARILVIPTDEELMIARDTAAIVEGKAPA